MTPGNRLDSLQMKLAHSTRVRISQSLLAAVLCWSAVGVVAAQEPSSTTVQAPQPQTNSQDQHYPQPHQSEAQPTAPPEPKQPDTGKDEVKITPREAEELFHSVDEILAFDSKHTGLPIKKDVKRRLSSRDEVVGYLTKHMKDDDVKRLQRSE